MKEVDFEGINYLIGENAQDNWDILKEAKQNWIWFHLDNFSSPYVIMKECKKGLKSNKYEKDYIDYIKMGCLLCKENSKYKSQKVKVIFTSIKNVSRGVNVGEALIKGKINSFVI